MKTIIKDSLANLHNDFKDNELAFLALTTKIELPLRDRWAFSLYTKLKNKRFVVSREWRRTDLAILKRTVPAALIELKAMYTFDAALDPSEIGGFANAMAKDEVKAKRLASDLTEIYTVLLATHPGKVNPEYSGIIKYDAGINKAIRKYGSEANVKEKAINATNNILSHRNVVSFGDLNGGKAFGVNTSILYWLVKA